MDLYKLFFFIIIAEAIAFYFLKNYTITHDKIDLFIGTTGYIGIAYLLTLLLSESDLGSTNLSWNIISSILGFVIGYLFFEEKLSLKQFIGIILSIIGLVLIYH